MDKATSKRWTERWLKRQGAFGGARAAAEAQDTERLARELATLRNRSVDFESHAKICVLSEALQLSAFEQGAKSELILALLLSGVDTSMAPKESSPSPLHAATFREAKTLRAVAARASDLGVRCRGVSPLGLLAGRHGSAENIAALLEAGADVNARGEDGLSALDRCAESGAIDAAVTARALILAGAEVESALKLSQPERYEEWGEARKRAAREWIAAAEAAALELEALGAPTVRVGKARL